MSRFASGYEKLAFGLLLGSGITVALLNPRSVRRFAQGMGLEEKTDRIDAGVIAWFAEVKQVAPTRARARSTAPSSTHIGCELKMGHLNDDA